MHKHSTEFAINTTSLVRFLVELAVTSTPVSHSKFIEKMAKLTDFSGSLTLLEVHTDLDNTAALPASNSIEDINEQFLASRADLITTISNGFDPDSGSRLKLPPIDEPVTEQTADYERYKRFYVAMQNSMDFKIKALRSEIRSAIAELNPAMAKLATLDTALAETLATRSQALLAAVPQLLARRFQLLRDNHLQQITDQPSQTTVWLIQFYHEMRYLLLAELEVRLLPVLGLLEALNEEVN